MSLVFCVTYGIAMFRYNALTECGKRQTSDAMLRKLELNGLDWTVGGVRVIAWGSNVMVSYVHLQLNVSSCGTFCGRRKLIQMYLCAMRQLF
ncbi:hypothetical protein LOAG_10216 [Loa loa]|uniref:Uncharacterized protein n=1 Tax=Loa loa TaxID=7209 RepID=A0A1S0TRV6_LOALO|nr:hypothetical protein LOAG_10216 [Loa loa]EFO18279.1 hypothetical protein LOAG_10216 [Loa loa]